MHKLSLLLFLLITPFLFQVNPVSAESDQPFTCADISEISQADCAALQALHDAGFGAWWFQSDEPCWWGGVGCSYGRISYLHLENATVTQLPNELGNLTQLEWLHISNTQILGTFGGSIQKLKKLEVLDLQNNPHIELDDNLGELDSLRDLYLINTGIPRLPTTIGNLSNLERLYIRRNLPLTSIPSSIGQLGKLRMLSIHDNDRLNSVPASISNLTTLTFLEIAGNDSLRSVSAELARENFPNVLNYWIDVPLADSPDSESGDCIIPASGPWPPCATGGAAPAPGNDCVIPPSGPWPTCAR